MCKYRSRRGDICGFILFYFFLKNPASCARSWEIWSDPIFLSDLHSDPDSVAFCVLATDEEYQCDIALQIHFTLIQAFCFDNDINVVRVNDIERLADLVGADETGESKDVHCILVTVGFFFLPPRSSRVNHACIIIVLIIILILSVWILVSESERLACFPSRVPARTRGKTRLWTS